MKAGKAIVYMVGINAISAPVLSFASSYYNINLRERLSGVTNRERIVKKYGGDDAYALVTGAGDGIGREQALEMARNGMNLILVSRSEDKLVQVGKECERINPNITITIRSCDFSKAEAKDYKAFFESDKIKGKNLRILVNNVGQIDRTKFFDLTPD